MNNIGIIISHGAKSGGSFQWAKNILESLNNFASNKNILVTAFILNKEDHENVFNNYDNIKPIKVHPTLFKIQNLIDKFYFRFPCFSFLYKLISPLNILSKFFKTELMIFPTVMSVCLYRNKFTFMFCDISHKYYPDFPEIGGSKGLMTRERIFSKGCSNATSIIVESEELKNEVTKFYQVPKDKIFVLFQTFSTSLLTNKETEVNLDLPSKYIFYPAQLWEHKNHKNLLKAFKLIRAKDKEIELVLTGFSKSGDHNIFQLISELGLNKHVHYLGYVKDDEIIELYTLEAFFYGCPAVISDLPGVYEQAQNAAAYFDPNDPIDIAKNILLLNDTKFRNKMIKEGYRRSNELSFNNYYNKTFQNILDLTMKL